MNILVTYKSKTGFSKRYAEIIAQRLGCAYMDIENVTQEVLEGTKHFYMQSGISEL